MYQYVPVCTTIPNEQTMKMLSKMLESGYIVISGMYGGSASPTTAGADCVTAKCHKKNWKNTQNAMYLVCKDIY